MEHAFNAIEVVDRLRIICTKCPAVANIRYRGGPPGAMSTWQKFVYYECHGEHYLAVVSDREVLVRWTQEGRLPEGPVTIADYQMNTLAPDAIDHLHQTLESENTSIGAFLDILEGFQQRRPERCAR